MRRKSFFVMAVVMALLFLSGLAFASGKEAPPPEVKEAPKEEMAEADFSGVTITIAALNSGTTGAISGPLYLYREEWEKMTGGKVNVAEIPFAQLGTKTKLDFITGAGRYDSVICCGNFYGDYIAGNFIIPLDQYYNDKSGKFPEWNIDDATPIQAALYKWGGKLYGVLFDCDGWVIYANKTPLENPQYKRDFKAKYGYDLALPETMDQFLEVSEFFNGWDWDNDGEVEYGNVLPIRVGGQMAFWFQSWIGSYITLPGPMVDDYHNVTFFNPSTMEPAINTPGGVKACEEFVRLYQSAPKASLGWDLAEAWQFFLEGNAVLCINPGDIGSLAQDPERSKIQGKLLTGPMPGRYEIWNRETNRWQKFDKPVMVGNTIGCSWHGVVSRLSKHPDAAYHFLAYIAQKKNLEHLTYEGWSGVDIGKIYDFPPEVSNGNGIGTLQGYLDAGYNRDDVLSYLEAYWKLYYESDTSQEYLRIPGAVQLLDAVDRHVGAALAGKEKPKAAMDAIAAEWNQIVDTLGRDTLKVYYQQSIGYGKPPTKWYK